ncbi:cathepsin L1-like, partial [Clarias magur]
VMMRALLLALLLSQGCCDINRDGYWISWKAEFNKDYTSEREEVYRRVIWEQKFSEVMKHNKEAAAGRHTYTMRINHLADMGKCNACWAFSAVGALEAQMKKKKGRLVPLSVQNLVDCSFGEGNKGCNAGLMTNAFNYIINHNGITKESEYPYKEKNGSCDYHYRHKYGRCSGFRVLQRYSEYELQKAVANIGPVAVGINSNQSTFHLYGQGIYSDYSCAGDKINHAVLVVGYGKEGGQQYWLIKN